ncbi:MAG: FmdB family zinc ribbon protein [Pseudomonadota bacterium]
MPIYEFYCTSCNTIFNFFSRTVNVTKRPACPRCGRELERQVSMFSFSQKQRGTEALPFQQQQAEDYVIATGETYMVRTFAEKVFERLGMALIWEGQGIREIGVDAKTGNVLIQVDPKHFRPAEVDILLGDSSKARRQLGWEVKTSFDQLVDMMTDADLKQAEREQRADG